MHPTTNRHSLLNTLPKAIVTSCVLLLTTSSTLIAQDKSAPLAELPFKLAGEHILVDFKVSNSDAPLTFVFDTGASATVFDASIGKELEYNVDFRQPAVGANGQEVYDISMKQSVIVNEKVSASNIPFVLVDLKGLSRGLGRKIAGITGNDLLSRYTIQLDYDDSKIRFYASGTLPDTTGYESLKFKYGQGMPIPIIETSFELPSGEKFTGEVLVDTGAGLAISVNTPFAEKNELLKKSKGHYIREGKGLNATSRYQVIKLKSLSIGEHTFGEMEGELATAKQGVHASTGVMAILGNQVLKRFNIVTDYKNRTMYLKPNHLYERDFHFNMAGLGLVSRNNEILIEFVVPESSAEKLGIQPDSRLVSINGKPCTDLHDTRSWLRKEGTTVAVKTIDSEGKEQSFDLPLKRILK